MNYEKRERIFAALATLNPDPKTELEHSSPFELLIAVVLSAQATDKSVNIATRKLYAVASTPAAIVKLGVEGVTPYIQTIGLFRNKAKNVVALSEILLRDFAGVVPNDRAALEALPGVGRKTANVVLNEVFGEPTIAVDTHLFRLGNRMKLAPGTTPDEVEKRLLKFVPKQFLQHAHHWLILHGRYTCTARNPQCAQCTVHEWCEWPQRHKNRAEQLTLLGERAHV
jgi:endonuclease III